MSKKLLKTKLVVSLSTLGLTFGVLGLTTLKSQTQNSTLKRKNFNSAPNLKNGLWDSKHLGAHFLPLHLPGSDDTLIWGDPYAPFALWKTAAPKPKPKKKTQPPKTTTNVDKNKQKAKDKKEKEKKEEDEKKVLDEYSGLLVRLR